MDLPQIMDIKNAIFGLSSLRYIFFDGCRGLSFNGVSFQANVAVPSHIDEIVSQLANLKLVVAEDNPQDGWWLMARTDHV
jgi:hypothetical protein